MTTNATVTLCKLASQFHSWHWRTYFIHRFRDMVDQPITHICSMRWSMVCSFLPSPYLAIFLNQRLCHRFPFLSTARRIMLSCNGAARFGFSLTLRRWPGGHRRPWEPLSPATPRRRRSRPPLSSNPRPPAAPRAGRSRAPTTGRRASPGRRSAAPATARWCRSPSSRPRSCPRHISCHLNEHGRGEIRSRIIH